MKKLLYNIYSNISDTEFLEFKARLEPIKDYMISILLPLGWEIDNSGKARDALAISFGHSEYVLGGSMGLLFNEKSDSKTFSFGLIKDFDSGNTRYFIKGSIAEDKPLNYFSQEIVSRCIGDALELYDKWTKEYIEEFGERVELL